MQYRFASLLEAMGRPGSQALLEKCLATRRLLRSQDPSNIQREVELMQVLARTGGLQETDQLADKVLAYAPKHPGKLFQTASAKAQCVRAIRSMPQPDTAQAEHHAKHAVNILNQAVDNGWKDARAIAVAPDLASLRNRPDFQAVHQRLGSLGPRSQ
jgi:hypothetical protein